mmetsp:Transcript_125455/g.304693  ORF Transcript_125455/g.304693 Transcript_125455/m.304693 type:complete len:84 (-) Transcript_125455:88-339(-)
MCCDIHIPPRSFNSPELLPLHKAIQLYILHAEQGALVAELDGEMVPLGVADHLLVRPGQQYCLRNDSEFDYARLKMVLVTLQG